jgi:hypothetical protein
VVDVGDDGKIADMAAVDRHGRPILPVFRQKQRIAKKPFPTARR